jgi:hypothetical protein
MSKYCQNTFSVHGQWIAEMPRSLTIHIYTFPNFLESCCQRKGALDCVETFARREAQDICTYCTCWPFLQFVLFMFELFFQPSDTNKFSVSWDDPFKQFSWCHICLLSSIYIRIRTRMGRCIIILWIYIQYTDSEIRLRAGPALH